MSVCAHSTPSLFDLCFHKYSLDYQVLDDYYTVSQKKNDADLACYNSDVHQSILIIFGTRVVEKVSYKNLL